MKLWLLEKCQVFKNETFQSKAASFETSTKKEGKLC